MFRFLRRSAPVVLGRCLLPVFGNRLMSAKPSLPVRFHDVMTKTRIMHIPGRSSGIEYSVSSLCGHLSFALLAASYGFKDMLDLRLMAVAAGIAMMAFNFWHPHGKPLWLPFRWNLLFIVTNGAHICYLLSEERKARTMSREYRNIFELIFEPTGMKRVDFLKLVNGATLTTVASGTHLCYEGALNRNVILIVKGRAAVTIRGVKVYELGAGQFVGEMGIHVGLRLASAMRASATVTSLEPTVCLSWPRGVLIDILESNESIARAVQGAISADLIRKLNHKESGELLTDRQLHWKAEKQYTALLERVLDKGTIMSHERNILRRYRIVHDITDDIHTEALQKFGWTVDEYEAGWRHVVNNGNTDDDEDDQEGDDSGNTGQWKKALQSSQNSF